MFSEYANDLSEMLHRAAKKARQDYEYSKGTAQHVRMIIPSEWRPFISIVKALGLTVDISPVPLPYFDIDGTKCKFPSMTTKDQDLLIRAVQESQREAEDAKPIDPSLPGTKGMSNRDFADMMRKKRKEQGQRQKAHVYSSRDVEITIEGKPITMGTDFAFPTVETATGAELDKLVAPGLLPGCGFTRLPGETDAEFRERIKLARG